MYACMHACMYSCITNSLSWKDLRDFLFRYSRIWGVHSGSCDGASPKSSIFIGFYMSNQSKSSIFIRFSMINWTVLCFVPLCFVIFSPVSVLGCNEPTCQLEAYQITCLGRSTSFIFACCSLRNEVFQSTASCTSSTASAVSQITKQ